MSAVAARLANPLRSAFAAAPKLRVCSPPSPLFRYGGGAPANITRNAIYNTRRGFSQSAICQEKRYTEQHEWVELAADGSTASVGITEYAAKALGDVVYVELPPAETEVTAGDTVGAVESVKSASDIMSPVSGTVVETNTTLEEKPKIVNDSPEGDGWFFKVKGVDKAELEGLLDAKEYKASLEELEEE